MYFTMEEDKRIHNRIQFRDLKSNVQVEFEPEEVSRIQDITVLFVEGDEDSIYPDVIEAPVYMVSDRLKKVLEMYDATAVYRKVILNQRDENIQRTYWLMIAEKIDCLDESSEWYPNGWNKKAVLERGKTKGRKVFRADGMMHSKVFVHVDVSESIMRRQFDGMIFHSVHTR